MYFNFTVVKAPFTFLQIQLKMLFWDTVKLTLRPLCLVPKILNSVDVVMLFCKMCAVIDSKMAELTHIQDIVTSVTICINDTVWFNLLADYG